MSGKPPYVSVEEPGVEMEIRAEGLSRNCICCLGFCGLGVPCAQEWMEKTWHLDHKTRRMVVSEERICCTPADVVFENERAVVDAGAFDVPKPKQFTHCPLGFFAFRLQNDEMEMVGVHNQWGERDQEILELVRRIRRFLGTDHLEPWIPLPPFLHPAQMEEYHKLMQSRAEKRKKNEADVYGEKEKL